MQDARGASLISDDKHLTNRRRLSTLLTVAALVVILDQGTKILAVTQLEYGDTVPLIGDFLQLRLVRNSGAAFGLATNLTLVLSLVAVGVVFFIIRIGRRLTSPAWAVALGGFLGGALGNLGDRVFREPAPLRGHVVDFLELPNWPVFNLADCAIVGAAVLVAVLSLRGIPHQVPAESADESVDESADESVDDDTGPTSSPPAP